MNASIIAALVRHVLTGVAGIFAAKYSIDGATLDAIISGATALVGVVWSVWDKKKLA
jgi:hypothetical protein